MNNRLEINDHVWFCSGDSVRMLVVVEIHHTRGNSPRYICESLAGYDGQAYHRRSLYRSKKAAVKGQIRKLEKLL